jgi:hypothetical protein
MSLNRKTQPASLEAVKLSNRELKVIPRRIHQPLEELLLNDTRWIELPFSSFNLEVRPDGLMEKLFREPVFLRQRGINQLQHLVPAALSHEPYPQLPFFPHSRLAHAKIVAGLGLALLHRNGYPINDQLRFAATAAHHDSPTPAGGDTVIRIDRSLLSEERNFARLIKDNSLDQKWRFFGFNLDEATDWVLGHGRFGQLLDILDKLSYTLLDTYFFIESGHAPKTLTALVESDPLFGDLWQEITIEQDRLHFRNPDRLSRFLHIRGLMHDQLYKNPDCRKMELLYSQAIEKLFSRGLISPDTLIANDDDWLYGLIGPIEQSFPATAISHRHFRKQQFAEAYRRCLNGRFIFTEHLKPFSTGLDWPVDLNGKIVPLHAAISPRSADKLERLSRHREGWHMFFHA